MRVYLAVTAKRPGTSLAPAIEIARRAIGRVLVAPDGDIAHDDWIMPGGDAALLAWTNEADSNPLPLIVADTGQALGIAGHLARPSDASALLAAPDFGAAVTSAGGCFCAFRVGGSGETAAATGLARACPVFHTETEHLHVVSNRALLAHLVARGGQGVMWDTQALAEMVGNGHFMSDGTPFSSVTALPPASCVTVKGGGHRLETIPLPDPRPAPTGERQKHAEIEELAQSLITAAEPLKSLSEPVHLTLTGGRDSRLLAALLHAAGIPFVTSTAGRDGDPDVDLARLVAAELGVEHQAYARKQSSDGAAELVDHPLVRAHNVIYATEGMISAYENVPPPGVYRSGARLGGHGGEILRGGFAHNQEKLDATAIRRRVEGMFTKGKDVLSDRADEHALALAKPWADGCVDIDSGLLTLDRLYVTHRVGRWHAASRSALLRASNPIPVYLDNRVVAAALALDPAWRRSEDVVFRLIEAFAPRLRNVPIEGKPWRFTTEDDKRLSLKERLRERLRNRTMPEAVRQASTGKPWNWRLDLSPELTNLLREKIIPGEAGPAAESISRISALQGRRDLLDGLPTQAQTAWHLYTVAVMLADGFADPTPPVLEQLKVTRPVPTA
ncbi:hypothetical protein Pth03_36960 [Planotetraspora thailandica]|uniref:Asparagine synthetase domain-containing protein n=1 Tax=Planotetraspora thailandica TaxID=487172 RepID=A0A8J3V108_9ACTN|nr:asparagine synthase-related protein [Planotetraspora thailandica]GII55307.1 hypothetical protein Pth03_36960 [Planotetraspora thailandica]